MAASEPGRAGLAGVFDRVDAGGAERFFPFAAPLETDGVGVLAFAATRAPPTAAFRRTPVFEGRLGVFARGAIAIMVSSQQ